jgi:hypothetical protein
MATVSKPGFRAGVQAGKNLLKQFGEQRVHYGRTSFYDPEFKAALKQGGISASETPAAFTGAYLTRLLGDVTTDETRKFYWRLNHPLAIADEALQRVVDPRINWDPMDEVLLVLPQCNQLLPLQAHITP